MKLLRCFPIFTCKGHVDSLDYSAQKLEDVPEIILKNHKHLEELNLGVNNIRELPQAFFKLVKLQKLDLRYNQLQLIPAEIGDLKCLIELDLSQNEISDIAPEIENCKALVFLDVSHNILTSGSLPDTISHLPQLTHLSVSENSLSTLPSEIDKLQNLRWLEARSCELRSLPSAMVNLSALVHLDLADNSLISLPAKFGKLQSLRELDLEENSIEELPEDMLQCKELEVLNVADNRLLALPEEIGLLFKLIELSADENHLSEIPTSIRLLTNLRILRLKDNAITTLPQSIGSMSSLRELYLSENKLMSIPSGIGNLEHLSLLDVSSNLINELPSTIGNMTNCGALLVRRNLLTSLPSEIGKLKKLRVLDAHDNKLENLPYTLLNLADTLNALYLVADRPKKVTDLQVAMDKYKVKCLTSPELPQDQYVLSSNPKKPSKEVKFPEDLPENSCTPSSSIGEPEPDDETEPFQFERYDTPHPRQFAPKYQKMIQTKRNSRDLTLLDLGSAMSSTTGLQAGESSEPGVTVRPLRSVLKKRPQSQFGLLETRTYMVRRDSAGGIGWNVTGGIDSDPPYRNNDYGIFVSRLNPEGPAEQGGIRVGDKILAVNGTPLNGLTHEQAVGVILDAGDVIEFYVETPSDLTNVVSTTSMASTTFTEHSLLESIVPLALVHQSQTSLLPTDLPRSHAPTLPPASHLGDIISVAIACDPVSGHPGFTVIGGTATMPITIDRLVPESVAELSGKLRVGDRLLSVNGVNMQFATLSHAQAALRQNPASELYIVVERIQTSRTVDLCRDLLKPSRSMPSIFDALINDQRKVKEEVFATSKTAAPPPPAFTKTHARKPSEDFTQTAASTFLIEFSREPGSRRGRAQSIGNLAWYAQNESVNQNASATVFGSTPEQNSQQITASIPPLLSSSSPTGSFPSPPPMMESRIPSLPRTTYLSATPKQQITSLSKIPLKAVNRGESKMNPPPVAAKPNGIPASTDKPPERLAFASKIRKFEAEINAQSTIGKNLGKTIKSAPPPPKKPLISAADLETLQKDDERRHAAELETIQNETVAPSNAGEYERLLDNIVKPVTMPAVVRTKNAEKRAAAANEVDFRSDSVASNASSTSLDPNEVEKTRRWRQDRLKSMELTSNRAEGIIHEIVHAHEIRQISRLSNISEDRSINQSPIPIK